MTDIILERTFDPPLSEQRLREMGRESGGCFGIYGVEWCQSLLATDGRAAVCWLRAPDAEAARTALRHGGADVSRLWPCIFHYASDPDAPTMAETNVLVTRTFSEPADIDELQALEDAGAWCLETHRVKFSRTFCALDRKRMICLYSAPDAESVRLAQRQAGMPVESVWAFRPIQP